MSFKLRAKGVDLCEKMSHTDTIEEVIQEWYMKDPFFQKVMEKMGSNPSFKEWEGFIWVQNRGVEDVVCIPTASSTTLH